MSRRKACQRPVVIPPSEPQILGLGAAARDDGMRVFTLVGAFSGLRLFEIAALEPRDLLDTGRVLVRRGKNGYRDEESILFEPGLSALREYIDGMVRGRLIFKTSAGGHYSRQYVSRQWAPMRRAVGGEWTFHATRHFHCCWLLDRGASDADVSKQLRHRDNGRLVKEIYGRWRDRMAALERLEALRKEQ